MKENVFMMLICVELKIPLFIIGKPGSSKSLAKTLIAQKMQGLDRSNSEILKNFKEAHLITFQCSPLSTAEMILKTFRYCAKYQLERKDDLERYTSVVVLDEIGLAEASPSMPLKTLHPLLEDGVYFDDDEYESLKEHKKMHDNAVNNKEWLRVGFIGISNWVLDPAKMNRGIFVNRSSPSKEELKETVIGICKNDEKVLQLLESKNLIQSLSAAYLQLCKSARKTREFFGLRDFYCLIKMIYWHIKAHYDRDGHANLLNWEFLERAIRRNFGGLIGMDPVAPFVEQFKKDKIDLNLDLNNKINIIDLIKEALLKKTTEDENRYLLLLSQNENALDLINNYIFNEFEHISTKNNNIKIIFGSSFPNDQKYSHICRKIHQIKLSMELGKIVILFNLENLYESLYDALNQFYYKFSANEKFVDLGLGTQRVKCLVHNDFKLIVVACQTAVYNPKKYPIPLVNRLEKHLLSIESILNEEMKQLVAEMKDWCRRFANISDKYSGNKIVPKQGGSRGHTLQPSDIFIGYTEDSVPTLIFKICKKFEKVKNSHKSQILDAVKEYLIQCASSDGVIRLLLNANKEYEADDAVDSKEIVETYFKRQYHDNFDQFFTRIIKEKQEIKLENNFSFIQVTTHSKLLSHNDIKYLAERNKDMHIEQVSLLSFDTQQQFVEVLREFYKPKDEKSRNVLIIQCDCGHFYEDLINCARYTIIDECSKYLIERNSQFEGDAYEESDEPMEIQENIEYFILLLIQIPKISGGCISGFQTAKWFCYHIDDLLDNLSIGNLLDFQDKSLSSLFAEAVQETNETRKYSPTLVNLLKAVIFVSCSKINDGVKQVKSTGDLQQSRPIKRIELLLKLLNGSDKFHAILLNQIARLQHEREQALSNDVLSRSWLFKEAAKLSNVIKYGTLKNSCISYIENRMSHLLSGTIAFIDTNHNLDLLQETNKKWVVDYWLDMFNDQVITNLNYTKYFMQTNGKEKSEFMCQSDLSRCEGIRPKLPFSWLIKQILDKLSQLKIKEIEDYFTNEQRLNTRSIDSDENQQYLVDQLQNAFSESHLYKKLDRFLQSIDNAQSKADFFSYYLNDLIVLTYKDSLLDDNYLKLVNKRILEYTKANYSYPSLSLNALIGYHLSMDKLKQEIYLFSKFAHSNPPLVGKLIKSEAWNSNLCFMASKYACSAFANARYII